MISSFKHKGLQDLFETGSCRGVTPHLADKLILILDVLNAAVIASDMNFPGSDLHPWKGVKDVWSVKVTGNWRVVFKFGDGLVMDVELIDPH